MEFTDALAALAEKVRTQYELIETEEATKNAFIMPFISTVLGYDVFNPQEVIPEFTADIGVKRGEKVDYAICNGEKVQILIECKKINGQLSLEHAGQLFRYFSVTEARIAILTNGKVWNFYTDLDAPNKMDDKPFLVLDLGDVDEVLLPELKKLTKDSFDLESIVSAAEELKYLGAIRRAIAAEFKEPSLDFVRLLTSRVYDGRFTPAIQDKFRPLVEKALRQFLNERVNDRIKTALDAGDGAPVPLTVAVQVPVMEVEEEPETEEASSDGIETTEEELFAYRIIKAIACAEVAPDRIAYRDVKSYFSVLLDDNNRKPIARCYFNSKARKWISFIDEDRSETRYELETIEDIYLHAEAIREAVRMYR